MHILNHIKTMKKKKSTKNKIKVDTIGLKRWGWGEILQSTSFTKYEDLKEEKKNWRATYFN